MSEGHLRQIQALELGSLGVLLFGDRLLIGGIGRGLSLVWGLYKSQILNLHSQYIRSFSIIGDPWL